jgi:hypothetical protein
MSIDGRKGGQITGRKSVESGHLAGIATLETRAKGGRISGRIAGRKSVEKGIGIHGRTPEQM